MKRRVLFFAVLAAVGLVVGFAWLLWPGQQKDLMRPALKLNIIRQTVESGRPVVFFRVEGAESGRMHLVEVYRSDGTRTEGPPGFPLAVQDFWAPSQTSALGHRVNPGKEFGVLSPTNAPVWSLQLGVVVSYPWSFLRVKAMWQKWRANLQDHAPLQEATRVAWNAYRGYYYTLVSGPITNGIPKPHS